MDQLSRERLSLREAAELLGVHHLKLWRAARAGYITVKRDTTSWPQWTIDLDDLAEIENVLGAERRSS